MAKKKSVLQLVKACRCRGTSSGCYMIDGEKVPNAVGLLLGIVPEVKCDKCGKRWREAKEKPPRAGGR
jgi:hypothetical protein